MSAAQLSQFPSGQKDGLAGIPAIPDVQKQTIPIFSYRPLSGFINVKMVKLTPLNCRFPQNASRSWPNAVINCWKRYSEFLGIMILASWSQ